MTYHDITEYQLRAAKEGQQGQTGLQGLSQNPKKNTARKSTAGSIAKIISTERRNVARKSTSGAAPSLLEEYSFYGAAVDPVDMSQGHNSIRNNFGLAIA